MHWDFRVSYYLLWQILNNDNLEAVPSTGKKEKGVMGGGGVRVSITTSISHNIIIIIHHDSPFAIIYYLPFAICHSHINCPIESSSLPFCTFSTNLQHPRAPLGLLLNFSTEPVAIMFFNSTASRILSSHSDLIKSTILLSGSAVAISSPRTALCDEEERNFDQTLKHHKNQLDYYQEKWNWLNASSRIPTVSWPTNIPDDTLFNGLKTDLIYCKRRKDEGDANERYCQDIQFRIAAYMLLDADEEVQKEALGAVRRLAEAGHPDSVCAYATCLNDGRGGLEINPKAAVSWWMNACEKYEHVQSYYELGVAFYTGDGVAEDESIAVEYFRRAADCGHAGASYMLGDCLLDGIGVARDRGEALEWLVTSAELGHRGARSRVLAVLEMDDSKSYGKFTDASRQSIASAKIHTKPSRSNADPFEQGKNRDDLEEQYSNTPVTLERRYTIGGGANNPHVLGRRKSIVDESRFDH